MIFPLYIPVLYPILWSKLWLLQMPWAIFLRKKNASHRIPGSSVRLAAHRSTRVSDDALETGKTGAVSCEPNDKYEDLKTQLLKSINVGKTTNRWYKPFIHSHYSKYGVMSAYDITWIPAASTVNFTRV